MKEKYPKVNKNTHKRSRDRHKKFYKMRKLSINMWAQKRKKKSVFLICFFLLFLDALSHGQGMGSQSQG